VKAGEFFGELKRRNVYKTAVAYGVFAWLLIQIATQVFPFFDIPTWAVRLVVLLLLIGLPVALIFAWVFEITPEGLKRTEDVPPAQSITHRTGRKLTAAIAVIIALAVMLLLIQLLRPKTREMASGASASSHEAGLALDIPEKSIAVLPFENRSDDKQNSYFADGVQDEILTGLSRVADLKVVSRTSVMQYKAGARNLREIGQQLGVAHVLEGSVQRVANRVRVTAQLVDTRTDAHLWAEYYDRDIADVFAIQSEIAETITEQLRAKLSPGERAAIKQPPTTDLAAYDLFFRARALYADTSNQIQAGKKLPEAARLLDEAVGRDPNFLAAWCLLARVHGDIYWQGHDHTPERLKLANTALQAALRLRPDAGEVHLGLADYYYHGFRDYGRARSELDIARRTLPNNPEVFEYTGYIDRREGKWLEATRNLERALELDPRNFLTLQQLALVFQMQHRYGEETRTYDRALAILPDDPFTLMSRAQVTFDERADIKPFQDTLAQLVARDPMLAPDVDDTDHALCERTPAAAARALQNYAVNGTNPNGANYPRAYWEGFIARCQGDTKRAQAAFSAAREEVGKIVENQPDFAAALSLLGMIDAGLGRNEDALREGRRACELLPTAKDAVDGAAFAVNLAQIYAWTGNNDLAIEQIAAVERAPNYLTYGMLKLHPQWDDLRGDPRFEQIVASQAPAPPK
jgi:TolB-like protein/Tfp pilus assembly protein PilF